MIRKRTQHAKKSSRMKSLNYNTRVYQQKRSKKHAVFFWCAFFVCCFQYAQWLSLPADVINTLDDELLSHVSNTVVFQQESAKKRMLPGNVNSTTKRDVTHMWDDEPFIHVINTRFMQHQGILTALAKARLHLFKTFTLPSILAQITQKFIWVIKVSPHLDEGIMTELIGLIQDGAKRSGKNEILERIYIVSSNENYNGNYGGWRGGEEIQEVLSHLNDTSNTTNSIDSRTSRGGIHTGNIDLLHRINALEPTKIMLQTRLDADDGLHQIYLQHIQKDALSRFGRNSAAAAASPTEPNTWFYWCSSSHIKWYLDGEGKQGGLDEEKKSEFCLTAALTLGFNIGTQLKDVPLYHHDRIFSELKPRNMVDCGAGPGVEQHCFVAISDFYGVIRSRTISSAGMRDVFIQKKEKKKAEKKLWEMVRADFNLSPESMTETKMHFTNNMKEIAKDNIKGQCSKGHSCKKKNKETLKLIMEK